MREFHLVQLLHFTWSAEHWSAADRVGLRKAIMRQRLPRIRIPESQSNQEPTTGAQRSAGATHNK